MNMLRGVFFMLIFCLIFTFSGFGQELDGKLEGGLNKNELSNEVTLTYNYTNALIKARLGSGLHYEAKEFSLVPFWRIEATPLKSTSFINARNQTVFKSKDAFNLIQGNNFNQKTTFTQINWLGFSWTNLNHVPYKAKDTVNVRLIEGSFSRNNFDTLGSYLEYVGTKSRGSSFGAELGFGRKELNFDLAANWQENSKGEKSQGLVGKIKLRSPFYTREYTWQKIEPGFESLFAKNNKYTPNRIGFSTKQEFLIGKVKLSYQRQALTNLAKTRNYPRVVWKLGSKDGSKSVEWRLKPTKSLVFRYSYQNLFFQFDPLQETVRHDGKLQNFSYSLRFDNLRKIYRVKLELKYFLELSFIHKYDFSKQRSFLTFAVEKPLTNGQIEFRIGKDDKGNLLSGFNEAKQATLSWQILF